MDGTILNFDPESGVGVIRASDGNRYRFSANDWLSPGQPIAGDVLDFEPADGQASEIFLVKRAAGAGTASAFAGFASRIWQQSNDGEKSPTEGQSPLVFYLTSKPATIAAVLILLASVLPFVTLPPIPMGGFEGGSVNLFSTVMRVSQAIGLLGGFAPATVSVPLRLFYLLLLIPASATYLLYRESAGTADDRLRARVGYLAVAGPIGIPLGTVLITLILGGGGASLGGAIGGIRNGANAISGFFGFGLMLMMAAGLTLIAVVKRRNPIKALFGSFIYLFVLGNFLDTPPLIVVAVAIGGGFLLVKVLQGWNPLSHSARSIASTAQTSSASREGAVQSAAAEKFCPKCGHCNMPAHLFCAKCGQAI